MSTVERSRDLVEFGDRGRLSHLGGLDGLRGIAVAAVVCFHGDWPWMTGGFLGVSLFFTLSGFLITSLLLAERAHTGDISLRSFWVRRFRRLLPAAWLTLAVVLAVVWAIGNSNEVSRANGDLLAAFGQVANWRFLFGGQSYGALFESPSPVLHYWSLAIEEQFYLLFPLLVTWLVAVTRGRRRLLGLVLGLMTFVSWTMPMVLGFSNDRVYYGTDTRAGELLSGALLAVVVSRPAVRRRLAHAWAPRTIVATLGALAGVASIVLWVRVEEASGFVTEGGLPLQSICSVALIAAVILPTGPVRAVCSVAPLRWLGRVSYGVYLYHWPLLVFLDRERTGLSQGPRFALIVALSLVLAQLSADWVEGPVRRGEGLFRVRALRPARLAIPVALAVVAGSLALGSVDRPEAEVFDAETAQQQIDQLRAERSETTTAPPATVVPTPPIPRIAVFGDSVAMSLALVIAGWEQQTGLVYAVDGVAELGCGIGRGGHRRFEGVEAISEHCESWPQRWGQAVAEGRPDLAIVSAGQWELVDRRLEGRSTWEHIGEPGYDEYLRSELLAATDVLASAGAVVVWLTLAPYSDALRERGTKDQRASHEPKRVVALNELIREVVQLRPQTARLIDLAEWMTPRRNDTLIRDDGSHYDWAPENRVVPDFLGPQIVATWDSVWRERQGN